jgi:hypothetical protein
MMDEHRTKIEQRPDLRTRWSSDSANAGENIVELLFDVSMVPRMSRELPVFRSFEEGLFLQKVSEALVTQLFGQCDDLRPLSTFGQQTREVIEVDSELAVLAVELGVASRKHACPNEWRQLLSGSGGGMVVPIILVYATSPVPLTRPSRPDFDSPSRWQAAHHFDGSLEDGFSASCENDVGSSAGRSIAFAMKRLCSTICSGLRQARSADHASM